MRENKALDLLNNCSSYTYIGDRRTMLYHSKRCPTLLLINSEDMQGCGRKPEGSGFLPCPRCLSSLFLKSIEYRNSLLKQPPTKASVMKNEIRILCYEYGLHSEFVGTIVFITTIAGEWFFDPNIRPILLHHKNNEKQYNCSGKYKIHSHIQDLTFSTPAHAIGYIYRHERATIKRLMTEEDVME